MNLARVSDVMRPGSTASRRLLFGLLAIAALIVGLIAMHSPAEAGSHSSGHAHGVVHSEPMLKTADAHLLAPTDCAGDGCGKDHPMMVMACVLALLVASIGFAGAALRGVTRPPASSWPARIAYATSPDPAPPSLFVLSISRT